MRATICHPCSHELQAEAAILELQVRVLELGGRVEGGRPATGPTPSATDMTASRLSLPLDLPPRGSGNINPLLMDRRINEALAVSVV